MLRLIFAMVVVAQSFSLSGMYSKWMPPVYDTSCSFTRIDALECFNKYVDVAPRDGGISPKEARLAVNRYSTAPIRALFWGLGTKQIFKSCDYDKNGLITPKDWMDSKKTCMPHKKNMCSIEWFCKRAKKIFTEQNKKQ